MTGRTNDRKAEQSQKADQDNLQHPQAADIIKAAAVSSSTSTVASAASPPDTDPDQTEAQPEPSFSYDTEEPPSSNPTTTTRPPALPTGLVVDVTTVTMTTFITVFV